MRPDHLLAVNAQVLPGLVRPFGDGQPPGDQRTDVSRPAGLDGQPAEVHVLAFPYDFLAGGFRQLLRRHVEDLLQHREFFPCIHQALGRLGFFQISQKLSHFPQRFDRFLPHAHRHAPGRAEQVSQYRNGVPLGFFEQNRRTAGFQHAVANFGHLQMRIDLGGDALEFALMFQLGDEIAQVLVFHERGTCVVGSMR